MAFEKKAGKDTWLVVGWINSTKQGQGLSLTVKDKDNNLLGFVKKADLEKVLKGVTKGAAIKTPGEQKV